MALQLLKTAPFFTQVAPAHRLTPECVIRESWNGLGWDRPLEAIQSSPPAISRDINYSRMLRLINTCQSKRKQVTWTQLSRWGGNIYNSTSVRLGKWSSWQLQLSRRLTACKYKNYSAAQSQSKTTSVIQSNTSCSLLLEFILAMYII